MIIDYSKTVQYEDVMSDAATLEDIKKAFYETFFRVGEIFFETEGSDKECMDNIDPEWHDFLENLSGCRVTWKDVI